MTQHLRACRPAEVSGLFSASASGLNFHLVIEGRYAKAYWMHVSVPGAAPFGKLDRFLRDIWVDCCGHLSAFDIDGEQYSSGPMEDELSLRTPLNRVLELGMKFLYEYDFGSPTALVLMVAGIRKPSLPKGAVQLLARNEAPQVSCHECGIQPATQICSECESSGEGWLCEGCAAAHECGEEMLLPVVNSPRAGVCGYAG